MSAESLAILRQKIRQIRDALLAAVRRAGLPDDCLNWLYFADSTTEAFSDGTTITYRDDDPHAPYHYITAERGIIYRDEGAADPHRFLYYPLQDITHYYELDHRLPDQDCRRTLFAKQLELLAAIHPDYAAWRKAEIDTVLQQHPYRDSAA